MINIPYLLKVLDTNKLEVLVENLEMSPLDMNLLLRDAEASGEIEIDQKKGKIKALKDPEISFDADIANKILRTIQHYNKAEINPTRTRILNLAKDPTTGAGYAWHAYLTSLQYLIDSGQIEEETVVVPKSKNNPKQTFTFLQIPENDNEEWNRREINKWVAQWNNKQVK